MEEVLEKAGRRAKVANWHELGSLGTFVTTAYSPSRDSGVGEVEGGAEAADENLRANAHVGEPLI